MRILFMMFQQEQIEKCQTSVIFFVSVFWQWSIGGPGATLCHSNYCTRNAHFICYSGSALKIYFVDRIRTK